MALTHHNLEVQVGVGPQELLDRHFPFAYPGQTPQMCFLRLLRASTGLGDSHLEHGPPCSDPSRFSPLPSLLLSRITSQISHSTWSLSQALFRRNPVSNAGKLTAGFPRVTPALIQISDHWLLKPAFPNI